MKSSEVTFAPPASNTGMALRFFACVALLAFSALCVRAFFFLGVAESELTATGDYARIEITNARTAAEHSLAGLDKLVTAATQELPAVRENTEKLRVSVQADLHALMAGDGPGSAKTLLASADRAIAGEGADQRSVTGVLANANAALVQFGLMADSARRAQGQQEQYFDSIGRETAAAIVDARAAIGNVNAGAAALTRILADPEILKIAPSLASASGHLDGTAANVERGTGYLADRLRPTKPGFWTSVLSFGMPPLLRSLIPQKVYGEVRTAEPRP